MTSTQSSTVKVIKVNNIFFKLNKRRIIVFRIANPYNILRQITNLTQLRKTKRKCLKECLNA